MRKTLIETGELAGWTSSGDTIPNSENYTGPH